MAGFMGGGTDSITTLVIACMDWRLNGPVDQLKGRGDTVSLRNAGGNVLGLEDAINQALDQYRNISKVVVMTHDDCGAMKTVRDVIRGKLNVGADVREVLVEQFVGKVDEKYGDGEFLRELESKNRKIQNAAIGAICAARQLDVVDATQSVGSIKLPAHPPGEAEATLVIARPSSRTTASLLGELGVSPYKAYVIEGDVAALLPDMKVAVGLGVKNMVLYAAEGEAHDEAVRDKARIESAVPGAKVTVARSAGTTGKISKSTS